MINWYAVETEADFRRREWQREVEAAARVAEADPAGLAERFSFRPRQALANLRSLLAPRPRLSPTAAQPCSAVPC